MTTKLGNMNYASAQFELKTSYLCSERISMEKKPEIPR